MLSTQWWMWAGFNLFVLLMLALDLGVLHRHARVVSVREALVWSGIWTLLAIVFNVGVWIWMGQERALQFFTGFLIERSLSVDNIFVFIVVFSYFRVPLEYQHRVLFWGILGALLMRAALIFAGAALLKQFHWIIYLFGGFLVLTGIRMAVQEEHGVDPEHNAAVRLVRRLFPVTPRYHEERFFVRLDGRVWATPLFVTLMVVEFTDLVFAVDSIPAIFAITSDTFIVYTSNVFAVFGLRALFFALAGIMDRFHYLKLGLSAVLIFVGVKMLLTDILEIPILLSLGVVVLVLAASVIASLLRPLATHAVKAPGPETADAEIEPQPPADTPLPDAPAGDTHAA